MDPSPYKFEEKNPRLVSNVQDTSMVNMAAGALFLGSLMWYNKRYFRLDSNVLNLAGFTLASLPASYVYANFALNSAENEAALANNARELQQ